MTKSVVIKSLLTAGALLAALVGFSVAFAAAPAAITHAETEVLKGTKFIAVMNGNTISGKTKAGTEFHAYFLTGGIAGYEDKAGEKDGAYPSYLTFARAVCTMMGCWQFASREVFSLSSSPWGWL